jgi:hypothetical protein
MSALGWRLRKLEDRFGIGNESFAQLHLRALRETARRDGAEEDAPIELRPPEDEPPEEAWRLILLNPRR